MTECDCPLAGYCERHKVNKSPHLLHLCRTDDRYYDAWEEGRGIGQKVSKAGQEFRVSRRRATPFCVHRGDAVGKADCGCSGSPMVYQCGIHGYAMDHKLKPGPVTFTIGKEKHQAEMSYCFLCEQFQGVEVDQVDAPRPEVVRQELVVSRYKESAHWVSEVPGNIDAIAVYNKGDRITFLGDPRARIIPTRNVGREAHTYLSHIVKHYDDLADTTFFAQGDPLFHSPDFLGLLALEFSEPTSLAKHYAPDFPSNEVKSFDLVKMIGPYETRHGQFMHFGSRMPSANLEWFPSAWSSVFACQMPDPYYFGYAALWAVPRSSIRSRPAGFYEDILKKIEHQGPGYKQFSEPIDAWAMEAMWAAVFAGPEKYPGVIS